MRKEKEKRREPHERLARPVVVAPRFVDGASAGDLLLPERVVVEPLVAVRDDDARVVPEPAAARGDREGERRVLAGVGLGEAHGTDGGAPVHDRHRGDVASLPGVAFGDPLRVIQVVVELAVAARAAVHDPSADTRDRSVALERAAGAGEPVLRSDGVRVEEREEVALGRFDAGVAGAAGVSPRRVAYDARSGLARRVGRAVRRRVVDHDHLGRRLGLAEGRGNRVPHGRGGVAAGDDDARSHEPVSLSS